MANDTDLNSAEKRRDSQTVFDFFQQQIRNNQEGLRNIQELASGPRFRMVSRAGSSFTNLNTEQTLISETIQGGVLQTTNIIEFEIVGKSRNASGVADNVTYRVKYGGSAITLGPVSLPSNAQKRLFRIVGWLYGEDSPDAQTLIANVVLTDAASSFSVGITNAYAEAALTINSAVDQTFAFSIQHATAQMAIGSDLLLYKVGAPIVAG